MFGDPIRLAWLGNCKGEEAAKESNVLVDCKSIDVDTCEEENNLCLIPGNNLETIISYSAIPLSVHATL